MLPLKTTALEASFKLSNHLVAIWLAKAAPMVCNALA